MYLLTCQSISIQINVFLHPLKVSTSEVDEPYTKVVPDPEQIPSDSTRPADQPRAQARPVAALDGEQNDFVDVQVSVDFIGPVDACLLPRHIVPIVVSGPRVKIPAGKLAIERNRSFRRQVDFLDKLGEPERRADPAQLEVLSARYLHANSLLPVVVSSGPKVHFSRVNRPAHVDPQGRPSTCKRSRC